MASLPLIEETSASGFPECDAAPNMRGNALHRDGPALADAWDRLAEQAGQPNPFAERWFLEPSLTAHDPHGSVILFGHSSGDKLRGLMPIGRTNSYYGYPVPHMQGWLHDNAFCGLPLVEQGHEEQFWHSLLEWVEHASRTALFLHLSHIPDDGPVTAALRTVLSERGAPAAIVQREERAMLASEQHSDAYFEAAMSGKKRKELRRQFNRLSECGEVRCARSQTAEGLAEWIEDFLKLEAAGWKGREGSALASNPDTARLFRMTLEGAARAGKLERLTLSLSNKPIAMLVNFLTPPGAFSFKTTFDEDYSRFSPGVLLQRENLALLDNPAIEWTDSCAAADHPMIERIWRQKRTMLRINIGLGGPLRRAAFRQMVKRESSAEMMGDW